MARVLVSLLLALFLWGAPSAAEVPLRICIDDWPPFEFHDDGGLGGLYGEVTHQVLSDMGLTIGEVVPVSWRRGLDMIRTGGCHALVSAFRTPERTEYALFPSEPFSEHQWSFYTLRDRFPEQRFESLDELRELVVGAVHEWGYPKLFLDFLKTHPMVTRSTTSRRNFEMLLAGRVDVVLEDRAMGDHLIRELDAVCVIVPVQGIELRQHRSYLMFSRAAASPGLVKRFSRALKRFKKTPRYAEIMDSHHH